MAKKLRKAADDIDVSDAPVAETTEFERLLLDRLDAARKLIEAQDGLLACYRLRRSANKQIDRLADARKAWEEVNG